MDGRGDGGESVAEGKNKCMLKTLSNKMDVHSHITVT